MTPIVCRIELGVSEQTVTTGRVRYVQAVISGIGNTVEEANAALDAAVASYRDMTEVRITSTVAEAPPMSPMSPDLVDSIKNG